MHVKLLKVFCDIVGRRSFSRAADENGISQSGASQMVQQLEEHLGVRLIDRSKRPFVLTPEGEVYYEGCCKIVQRYFALEEEVRTLHQELAGKVSVAAIYSVGLTHINQYVADFLRRYPKANVRVEYQHPEQVVRLVEEDRADFGFVSYPESSRTVKAVPWIEEPMALACAPGHRFAGRESVGLSELHGEPMVGFTHELQIRREIDRALEQAGAEVKMAMQFDNIETVKRAIEIGAGVALLPIATVEREVSYGTLKVVPLRDARLARPIGMIYRRGRQFGRTARRFKRLLLKRSQISNDHAAGELLMSAKHDANASDAAKGAKPFEAAHEKTIR